MKFLSVYFTLISIFILSGKTLAISESSQAETHHALFSYDSKTHVFTPDPALIEMACNSQFSDSSASNFLEVLKNFSEEVQDPFGPLENSKDLNLYVSFQNLKREYMSHSPDLDRLDLARDLFSKALANSQSLQGSMQGMRDINAKEWDIKIYNAYATMEAFDLQGSGSWAWNYTYLSNRDTLKSRIYDTYRRRGVTYTLPPSASGIVENVFRGSDLNEQYQTLIQELSLNSNLQSHLDMPAYITKKVVSPEFIDILNSRENLMSHLLRIGSDPQKSLCQKEQALPQMSNAQAFEWCYVNDSAFAEALGKVVLRANEAAQDMRLARISPVIRAVVGVHGAYCNIQGYYHLLKVNEHDVQLTTSGSLYVHTNSKRQQTRFNDADLLIALDPKIKANFRLGLGKKWIPYRISEKPNHF